MTTVAMYSHASRSDIRAKTLQLLEGVNMAVDAVTVQDTPPKQSENRRNAHTALTAAFNDQPVLVIEDDIIPNRYLPDWLAWLSRTSNSVTTLYACVGKFYDQEIRRYVENHVTVPPHLWGIRKLEGLRGFYGAQAVWIPTRIADEMIHDRKFQLFEHEPYGPWDHAIRTFLQNNGYTMNVTIPNLVQHQAPPSVVNRTGPRHKTPIFDLAARPPAKE